MKALKRGFALIYRSEKAIKIRMANLCKNWSIYLLSLYIQNSFSSWVAKIWGNGKCKLIYDHDIGVQTYGYFILKLNIWITDSYEPGNEVEGRGLSTSLVLKGTLWAGGEQMSQVNGFRNLRVP